MTFSFYLALAVLLFYSLAAIDLMRGNRLVRPLRTVAPVLPQPAPGVSIIVAARNEARNLRQALASLQALDYPDLELIVVNDRSEDDTGAILEEMARGDARLQVVTVRELPAGWLGKNYALWLGSRRAGGELLLFTDADIIMEPSLLRRAVALMDEQRLDHLAVSPRVAMPGTLLSMFGLAFMLFFSLFARPWKARDPKSYFHIGIGAFNLVRTEAYRACGGHEAIRMRPDDDMKLGKLLKKNGFSQDIAAGAEFMSVEWYATLGEVIRGLEKNAFAGCDYRLRLVLSGMVVLGLCCVWPYLALLVTGGAVRLIYLLVVTVITVVLFGFARSNGTKRWHVLGFPLAATIFIWILLRTTALNLLQGGINWRGTFYSLDELKKNRI
jgi:glycosyltransferase involved in cell wall biosynthesis